MTDMKDLAIRFLMLVGVVVVCCRFSYLAGYKAGEKTRLVVALPEVKASYRVSVTMEPNPKVRISPDAKSPFKKLPVKEVEK